MASIYNGLEFETSLKAQWAAFFDLAGWRWWGNPVAIGNWKPDFKVTFDCDHSECNGSHTLLVAILPFDKIDDFNKHPCLPHKFVAEDNRGEFIADGGAAFGNNPSVTEWVISHGSGGGTENIYSRVVNANELWLKAKKLIQFC